MNVTASTPPILAPASRLAPLVGKKAAQGALWTILFSVLNKSLTLGSQIALAWFLVPEEFGLVAMALSVTGLAAMMAGTNLRNILVQRPERFAADAGQVFWLSLFMNLAAAGLLAACSPVVARAFHQPKVALLILVASMAIPIHALATSYSAALYRNLRFRSVATINFIAGAAQNGSAIFLAWRGFGALALVLPLVVTASVLAILNRLSAGRLVLGKPQPRLWPALLAPTGWLMVNSLFLLAQNSGANFVIGLAHNASVTGFYYWGFAVSSQAIFLLAMNLQSVLFPVLSKLNEDPDRQFEAVRKACQTLTLAAVPVCVLQALLAPTLIELLFHPRWLPAVPVVQWISLGLVTQPLGILSAALLMARGRFRKLAATSAGVALSILAAAAVGAGRGQQDEIARWTGAALFLTNLFSGWVAFHELGRTWRHLTAAIIKPLALGAAVSAVGVWLAHWTTGQPTLVQTASVGAGVLAIYALLAKLLLPGAIDDVLAQLRQRNAK